MPWFFGLTVIPRPSYAVTVVEVLEVYILCWAEGAGSTDPLACVAIWAHVLAVILYSLKFAALGEVVFVASFNLEC